MWHHIVGVAKASSTTIDMYVDGDWVRAKGTTLGADNGLGVAAIMAISNNAR